MAKFFSKAVAFVKKPAVSHSIAVAATALATYLTTGHVDLSQILK